MGGRGGDWNGDWGLDNVETKACGMWAGGILFRGGRCEEVGGARGDYRAFCTYSRGSVGWEGFGGMIRQDVSNPPPLFASVGPLMLTLPCLV